MISILDMFSIGVGPSSSHTVGPMRAAHEFVTSLEAEQIDATDRAHITLYGSLALTGLGHGTDRAAMSGLEGNLPETVDTQDLLNITNRCEKTHQLNLAGRHTITFDYDRDVTFDKWHRLSFHTNGMLFEIFDKSSQSITSQVWYSVGGGFIQKGHTDDEVIKMHANSTSEGVKAKDEQSQQEAGASATADKQMPIPYKTMDELLKGCHDRGLTLDKGIWENELANHDESTIREILNKAITVMRDCVVAGCNSTESVLPGGLNVSRRAPLLYKKFTQGIDGDVLSGQVDRSTMLEHATEAEWTDLFALAVNEENAGGGRVVTAPTNGSAGVIPAVLHYYRLLVPGTNDEGIMRFLLVSGAIGVLFKSNASISAAEVGCQGEIGSACSMAAGGLCAALGGSSSQIENAAEIGIEHNLGLTCDPIKGLVQIPCIERNAIASNTAINAANMALLGDGQHIVSLDDAIETMRQTGMDMMDKYKETSEGGLAVNVVEC